MFLRRLWYRLFPPEKSVLALRELLRLDDDEGQFYPKDWPVEALRGKLRRARLTRPGYETADPDKVQLRRAEVISLAERKERAK